MRKFILAAVGLAAATVPLAATSASAQPYRGGYGYNQREVRQEMRECRRELRRADSRREYRREARECQREVSRARRGYNDYDRYDRRYDRRRGGW